MQYQSYTLRNQKRKDINASKTKNCTVIKDHPTRILQIKLVDQGSLCLNGFIAMFQGCKSTTVVTLALSVTSDILSLYKRLFI